MISILNLIEKSFFKALRKFFAVQRNIELLVISLDPKVLVRSKNRFLNHLRNNGYFFNIKIFSRKEK
jgi:hypothetical protein